MWEIVKWAERRDIPEYAHLSPEERRHLYAHAFRDLLRLRRAETRDGAMACRAVRLLDSVAYDWVYAPHLPAYKRLDHIATTIAALESMAKEQDCTGAAWALAVLRAAKISA